MKSGEEAVQLLEQLRDKWSHISLFLNDSTGGDGMLSDFNKMQSRVVSQCSADVYRVIEEIKETF